MVAERILRESGIDPSIVDTDEVIALIAQGRVNEAVNVLCEASDCRIREATGAVRDLQEALREGRI